MVKFTDEQKQVLKNLDNDLIKAWETKITKLELNAEDIPSEIFATGCLLADPRTNIGFEWGEDEPKFESE